jgi:hypothetical protein
MKKINQNTQAARSTSAARVQPARHANLTEHARALRRDAIAGFLDQVVQGVARVLARGLQKRRVDWSRRFPSPRIA